MNEDLSDAEKLQTICNQKLTWATKALAEAAASYAAWQYGLDTGKPKPYQCRNCHLWHLARYIKD